MSYKVMKDNLWLGTVREFPQGFRFITRMPHGGNSRKYYDTPENAIPRQIKKLMTNLEPVEIEL